MTVTMWWEDTLHQPLVILTWQWPCDQRTTFEKTLTWQQPRPLAVHAHLGESPYHQKHHLGTRSDTEYYLPCKPHHLPRDQRTHSKSGHWHRMVQCISSNLTTKSAKKNLTTESAQIFLYPCLRILSILVLFSSWACLNVMQLPHMGWIKCFELKLNWIEFICIPQSGVYIHWDTYGTYVMHDTKLTWHLTSSQQNSWDILHHWRHSKHRQTELWHECSLASICNDKWVFTCIYL